MKKILLFLLFIGVAAALGYGLWKLYALSQPQTQEVKLFPTLTNAVVLVNTPEPVVVEEKPEICAQVVTYAREKESTECQMFATPCDVPKDFILCEEKEEVVPPPVEEPVVPIAPVEITMPEEGKVITYFLRPELGPNCEDVFPLQRTVPESQKTQDAMIQAVLGILRPLSAEEQAQGFETSLPAGTKLKKLWVANGTATVDFSVELNSGGGSCMMASRRAQIEKTLKQFPEVSVVVITVNGSAETALQP